MRKNMYDEDVSNDMGIISYGESRCFFGVVEVW